MYHCGTAWINTTSALPALWPVRQFKKTARLVVWLGSGPRLVGRIGSVVRVSASFQMPAS